MNKTGLTRREFLRISALGGISLVAAACAPTPVPGATATAQPAAAPRVGGILRRGESIQGVSLGYPAKLVGAQSNRQVAPVVETLLRYDKAGMPVPWLATEAKGDVAAKTITLTLRKGVKLHDGTDFDAEAVKWNLEQCVAAKVAGTQKFKSMDLPDASTVRITLSEWDSTVVSGLCGTLGLIVSPAAYKKNGEEWAMNNPVGTGAFQFVSLQKDTKITYKRFDGYWQKGKPYLDGIEIVVIADSATREMSFKGKELDTMTPDFRSLAALEEQGFKVQRSYSGSGAGSIVPDSVNKDSPFAKLQVRQALNHAIDPGAIAKTIFYGAADAPNQWSYKGHWSYNDSVTGYPYNPEKAKQLLAEAGYPNGFKTKLVWLAAGAGGNDLPTAVQGFLKAVGIDAEIDLAPSARFNSTAFGGKWEGLIFGTASGDPETLGQLVTRYGGTGWYTQMLVPDDYKQVLQNAITAPDFATKQKYTQDAMKMLVDKYALVIPVSPSAIAEARQPYVHDVGLGLVPSNGQWTPEDAWTEKAA